MKIYYTFSLFVILTLQMSNPAFAQNHDSLILVEFYKNMDGENWKNDSNWLVKPVNTWYGLAGYWVDSSFSVSELALPRNNLKGTLDTSLSDLFLLSNLNLSSNSITGNIPPELGKLSILTYMDLSGNNLTDSIPSELGKLSNISSIDLSFNNLTGGLPAGLEKLYTLKNLSLSNNKLTGTIPEEWSWGTFNSLYTLNLSSNKFSGSIPYIANDYINLYDVSHNHFSGSTSNLLDYFDGLSVGRTADISYNNFNFNMEAIVEKVSKIGSAHGFELIYAPQYKIPIHYSEGKLSVSAGGTLNNNTYHWYKDEALDSTIKGDSTFMPVEKGAYYVIVENTIATELKLESETIDLESLPISNVLNFNCTENGDYVVLNWQIIGEENIESFNVQKSVDGINFVTIGKMSTKGSTYNAPINYSYTDKTFSRFNVAQYFYRLEIVHYNGGKELSSVATISIRRTNSVTIYPNPANNYLNVEIQNYSAKNIYMRIFDVTGKRVKEVSLANEPTQQVSVKELKPGLYHIIISHDYQISYETELLVK